jgi:hypothetical protein
LKAIISLIDVKGVKMSLFNSLPNISIPSVKSSLVSKILVCVGFSFCSIGDYKALSFLHQGNNNVEKQI